MRTLTLAVSAVALLAAVGCGGPTSNSASPTSGVTGLVHLGPQCPVEQVGQPCDKPAANETITVSEQVPGDAYVAGAEVATATTDAQGAFRVPLEPGAYVVTAEAGMSCELMDVRVTADEYAVVDVPCDTGIR